MDSDGNTYRIEPTVFNSNTNRNANSNIYSDANSTTKSENAYKASI